MANPSSYYSGPPAFLISFLKDTMLHNPQFDRKRYANALSDLWLLEEKGSKHAVVEFRYVGTKRAHIVVAGCMELVA